MGKTSEDSGIKESNGIKQIASVCLHSCHQRLSCGSTSSRGALRSDKSDHLRAWGQPGKAECEQDMIPGELRRR